MDSLKYKQCGNCKKDIEESKLMLHEPFCARQYKYCDKCKDVVEVANMDEHEANHLTEKQKQPQIESKVELKPSNPVIKPNENIIPKIVPLTQPAQINCQFCELQLAASEQKSHEAICGARTDLCEYCNEKMLVKQLKSHLNSCTAKMLLEQGDFDDEYLGEADMLKKFQQEEDERLAQLLAKEGNHNEGSDFKFDDEALMRKMQLELDEKLAKEMENEGNSNVNNLNPEEELDENLRRALELSRNNK